MRRLLLALLALPLSLCAQLTIYPPKPPSCTTYQVNSSQSTLAAAAATTASVNLFTLAQGWKVTGITIKPVTAFTAPSMTALSVSLGGNSNNTAYSSACSAGGACDVTAASSNTNMLDDGGQYSVTWASHPVYAYFASTGANLNTLSAGQVNITVCTVQIPTATTVVP